MFNRKIYCHQYYLAHKAEITARSIARHKANPKAYKEYFKKAGQKLKLDALHHYSMSNPPSCVRCGISDTDILTIDHIEGGGTQHRKTIQIKAKCSFYRWLKRNNYPEGYQVLCWNCNFKKRIREKK